MQEPTTHVECANIAAIGIAVPVGTVHSLHMSCHIFMMHLAHDNNIDIPSQIVEDRWWVRCFADCRCCSASAALASKPTSLEANIKLFQALQTGASAHNQHQSALQIELNSGSVTKRLLHARAWQYQPSQANPCLPPGSNGQLSTYLMMIHMNVLYIVDCFHYRLLGLRTLTVCVCPSSVCISVLTVSHKLWSQVGFPCVTIHVPYHAA